MSRLSENPNIAPSLLACDFGRLDDEIGFIAEVGADVVHWDVMDGRFVPNLTYGPPVIQSCRTKSPLLFDAHLMIEDPDRHLQAFFDAGCDSITIHLEAVADPKPILGRIRSAGRIAGLAIKPATDVRSLEPFFGAFDLALVMSVEPGFGGQKFLPTALDKLDWLRTNGPNDLIRQVDGGVDLTTAAAAVKAGAVCLVVGTAFFNAQDRRSAFHELQKVFKP